MPSSSGRNTPVTSQETRIVLDTAVRTSELIWCIVFFVTVLVTKLIGTSHFCEKEATLMCSKELVIGPGPKPFEYSPPLFMLILILSLSFLSVFHVASSLKVVY